MEILLLTNKPPWPPRDGGAYATLNIIQGLFNKGASITVLYLNTSKHSTNIKDIPEEYSAIAQYHCVRVNTKIRIHSFLANLFFSNKPYNLVRFESKLIEKKLIEILATRFDIVQCEGIAFYRYYKLIRSLSGARLVFRPHNVENKIWCQIAKEEKNPLKKIYYGILSDRIARIEKAYLNVPDCIVAISKNDLDWFKAEGFSKPSIVFPFCIDPGTVVLPIPKEQKIGFIGSLDWIPNVNGLKWFIRYVWPVISLAFPNATLHISGRNGNKLFTKSLQSSGIFYHGEVVDAKEFMRDKSIIIAPLFAGSGMRIKIIEALSLGKCVVATSISASGIECSEETLFIADTETQFAEIIKNILPDELLMKRISTNAIDLVHSKYNIFATSENLIDFYSNLT